VADERQPEHTPVERLLARKREHEESGHRLSDHAFQYQRTLEGYLQAGNRPRWMERLAEIEAGTSQTRRRLLRAYRDLRAEVGEDHEAFARRWRELAATWDFGEVNERIRQHNDWFPIERRLAIDPRTRDYVKINGRSYRKRELDAGWILEEFPADAEDEAQRESA
jgi:hypothetical protein